MFYFYRDIPEPQCITVCVCATKTEDAPLHNDLSVALDRRLLLLHLVLNIKNKMFRFQRV